MIFKLRNILSVSSQCVKLIAWGLNLHFLSLSSLLACGLKWLQIHVGIIINE